MLNRKKIEVYISLVSFHHKVGVQIRQDNNFVQNFLSMNVQQQRQITLYLFIQKTHQNNLWHLLKHRLPGPTPNF